MRAIIKSLVIPDFWAESAAISGFTVGNTIALAIVSALLYCLGAGFWIVASACIIILLLSVPITIYMLNTKWHVRSFDSPAYLVSGFVFCVALGATLFIIVPVMVLKAIRERLTKPRRHKGNGREAFYSIASSVAHYTEGELAASYFHSNE